MCIALFYAHCLPKYFLLVCFIRTPKFSCVYIHVHVHVCVCMCACVHAFSLQASDACVCCMHYSHVMSPPSRVRPSDVGLLTGVAFMGAPVIITEKLVAGFETLLALDALQRVLVSGVYTGEGGEEEGKRGNERVRVNNCDIGGGNRAWIAHSHDLATIDISDPAKIQQVTLPTCAMYIHVYVFCIYIHVHCTCSFCILQELEL